MTDQSLENFAQQKEVLERIANKTKPYKNNSLAGKIISIGAELLCYALFLGFLAAAYYLPGYLEIKLDAVEDEIGFYTLDPEERIVWIRVLRAALGVLSAVPLVTAVLLRVVRRRAKVLREVYGMVGV